MLKTMLWKGVLSACTLAVVGAVASPSPALARERKKPGGAEAAAAAEDGENSSGRRKPVSKDPKKAAARAAAEAKLLKASASKQKATVAALKAEADAAEADAAAAEAAAAKKNEGELHAKRLGKIERLEQIATATSNDPLKAQVAKLRELEDKRHGLVSAKFEAPAAGDAAAE